jgi:hypothetical protein
VAAVVKAAHRISEVCPLPPCETQLPPRRGHRGRSRSPPVRSPRPPVAAARQARPNRRHVVATVVEAASHQSDLRGRPLPSRETCRCAVVTVVEAAHCAMVAGAWLGGGVNVGPRPPSYSSSSLYRSPWLTTTSSFSSTAPVGRRRRPRRDDGNSIVLCAAPSRCPTS